MRRRPTCKQGFLSLSEARSFVRNLNFPSSVAYKVWAFTDKRPQNIPVAPEKVYADWKGWIDYLGKAKAAKQRRRRPTKDMVYMSYKEASEIVKPLALKSVNEFKIWASSDARPEHFPSNPDVFYKEEWKGYKEFLGKEEIPFMSFSEYKALIKPLEIKTEMNFRSWAKSTARPMNAPSNPDKFYKDEWKGWPDFLNKSRT